MLIKHLILHCKNLQIYLHQLNIMVNELFAFMKWHITI